MSQVIDFEQQRRLHGYAKRVTAARIKILLNERRFANGAIAVEAFELERDASVAELLRIQAEIEATLEKLAEEVRANNPKLTTAQAFSKAIQMPEGQELYRQDKGERLGTAVAWGRV
jgi:hypothetical protein